MKKSKDLFFGAAIWIIIATIFEFHSIASGTGNWVGEFSLKWGVGFAFFIILLIFLLAIIWFSLWKPEKLQPLNKHIIPLRQKLNLFRWVLVLPIIIILPVYFFQYTFWGLVFKGIYFRLFVWILLSIFLAILLTREEKKLITWFPLISSILLTGTGYSLASVFTDVTDYPFNLFWSDGNRLWDYSLIFGKHIYNYPLDQPITSLTSSGRQFLWGLPFLLPNTNILFHRFWSALVLSLPYVILGWIVFSQKGRKNIDVLLLGFWAFLFLNQGPIYTPLIISAILVALVWEHSLWLAIPVVAIAGYYAEMTRWTWEFAPAIWAGMLSLNNSKLNHVRLTLRAWVRVIALAIAGISIWYLYPAFQNAWKNQANPIAELGNAVAGTVSGAQEATSSQPLLWNRLLPNDTYPEGILGGLLIAIMPLAILLIYLIKKKYWQPSLGQKIIIGGALFPFLIVGLIISTKIGGGNNLHNLDMFLIAILLVTAIAWRNGGRIWFTQEQHIPLWTKGLIILLVALPAFKHLLGLRPNLSLNESQIKQVQILTDSETVESLPAQSDINDALWLLRHEIDNAQTREGDILFIDQRQLLTFGYVPNVPLVPDYEKKRMMNEAMSSNADYFSPYYEDLAAHRYSLIISEPLRIVFKGEEGIFSAENDLWTKWIAAPTLCYYEPLKTLGDVRIQLLIPREEAIDCTLYLP